MLGVDRYDLTQTFFALGLVGADRGQPQPGGFVARLGDQHEMEYLASLVGLAALR
jgi:hypothetical protein